MWHRDILFASAECLIPCWVFLPYSSTLNHTICIRMSFLACKSYVQEMTCKSYVKLRRDELVRLKVRKGSPNSSSHSRAKVRMKIVYNPLRVLWGSDFLTSMPMAMIQPTADTPQWHSTVSTHSCSTQLGNILSLIHTELKFIDG